MNSILTNGLSMRDPEGDDYVSQSLSRPATPTATKSDNPPAALNSRNGQHGSTNDGNSVSRSSRRSTTPSISKRDNSAIISISDDEQFRSTDGDNLVAQPFSSTVTPSTKRDNPQASAVSLSAVNTGHENRQVLPQDSTRRHSQNLTGSAVITQTCDNRHRLLSRWF